LTNAGGIPAYGWLIIGVVVLAIIIAVVVSLLCRSCNQKKKFF